MHSFTSHGVTFTFTFDADLSGPVNIFVPSPWGGADKEITLPGATALLEFVAEYVRRQKIAALEQTGACEVLGKPSA